MFQYANGFSLTSNPQAHEYLLSCLQTYPVQDARGNQVPKQEVVAQVVLNDVSLIALCRLLGDTARSMHDMGQES